MPDDGRRLYRFLIDELVSECRQGQGQIGPDWARAGRWKAGAGELPDGAQRRISVLLAGMAPGDREVVAQMLAEAFQDGVFITLRVLHDHGVPPFEDGYEGSPFNDFIGRLYDWPWPAR